MKTMKFRLNSAKNAYEKKYGHIATINEKGINERKKEEGSLFCFLFYFFKSAVSLLSYLKTNGRDDKKKKNLGKMDFENRLT